MSWSTIAASEVLEEFTDSEKTLLNNIQGASTQLAAILARTVNAWRAVISGNQTLGATNTIPADVRPDVIAEARWRWLVSLPASGKTLQTKERQDLYNQARELLDKIRDGLLVESADDAPTGPAPSITSRCREAIRGRENSDGTTEGDSFDGM